ncbi:MAG: tRNA lysidine(34) synthetase TilS [Deltaproteobacteria bacterium]|nr:tRNA lysidine(34) synthetase TilS [Deltaproteobacteria bacterium]
MNFRNCFKPSEKLVLGVSGGVDSVALLHLLIQEGLGPIVVAHCDHGLRIHSKEDLLFVEGLASHYKLKIESVSCKINELAKINKQTLEECGRHFRYAFFEEVALKHGAQKIVTAHTADDQVETLLMNWIRGAGSRGLQGIAWQRPVQEGSSIELVRPLLSTWKKDIYAYAKKHELAFREDSSNKDTKFRRNHIRLELIPKLSEKEKNAIYLLSETFRSIEDKTQILLKKLFREFVLEENNYLKIKMIHFYKMEPDLQFRFLEKMVMCATENLLFRLSKKEYFEILKMLQSYYPQKHIFLRNQFYIFKEYAHILISKENLLQDISYQYEWNLLKKLHIKEVSLVLNGESVQTHCELGALDRDLLGIHVTIRNFREGDRFTPFNHQRSHKLKDFFIEQKVPLRLRRRLPLLQTEKGEIAWVGGIEIDDAFKATKNTQNALKLTIQDLK